MTDVETRLRSLRHALVEGPTAAELRNRAARRRVRRHVTMLAVPLLILAGASLVWAFQDNPSGHVIAGPDNGDPSGDPVRTLGDVEGVTVAVSPEDQIGDGHVV